MKSYLSVEMNVAKENCGIILSIFLRKMLESIYSITENFSSRAYESR